MFIRQRIRSRRYAMHSQRLCFRPLTRDILPNANTWYKLDDKFYTLAPNTVLKVKVSIVALAANKQQKIDHCSISWNQSLFDQELLRHLELHRSGKKCRRRMAKPLEKETPMPGKGLRGLMTMKKFLSRPLFCISNDKTENTSTEQTGRA